MKIGQDPGSVVRLRFDRDDVTGVAHQRPREQRLVSNMGADIQYDITFAKDLRIESGGERLDDSVRGRVMALWVMGFGGTVGFANIFLGTLMDATSVTAAVCPVIGPPMGRPESAFHSRSVVSPPPETMKCPLGLNATANTASV